MRWVVGFVCLLWLTMPAGAVDRPLINDYPERVYLMTTMIPNADTIVLIRPECDSGEHRASCMWSSPGGVLVTAAGPTPESAVNELIVAYPGGNGAEELAALILVAITTMDPDIGTERMTELFGDLISAQIDGDPIERQTDAVNYSMFVSSTMGAWFFAEDRN